MEKPAVVLWSVDVAEGDRAGAADFGPRPGQRAARGQAVIRGGAVQRGRRRKRNGLIRAGADNGRLIGGVDGDGDIGGR